MSVPKLKIVSYLLAGMCIFSTQSLALCEHLAGIAHRGLSGLAPEESEIAYLLASDLGANFIEMDIQRTRDGVLILNHDLSFSRTTNIQKIFPRRANDPVSSFTFSEVQELETGERFNQANPGLANAHFLGSRILRLEDAITLAQNHPNHPGMYIESKNPELYPDMEAQMSDLILNSGILSTQPVIFESFSGASLAKFRSLAPMIPRVLLLTNDSVPAVDGLDFGIGPDFSRVSTAQAASLVTEAHAKNLQVHFYTVDTASDLQRLISTGADGVFTDRVDTLFQLCGKLSQIEVTQILSARFP